MTLSVIIPCFNGARTLGAQLEALARQTWPSPGEVIVSDNGSTDDSAAIVESYKARIPNLRVADASARRGQPYALNVGAAAARGDALAFCDADDEVGSGWVEAMSSALSRYDFVAGRIDTQKLNAPWLATKHPQADGLQKARYPPYLPHAGGGTIGVKKNLHEAVGGFDEALPYLHDTDFCFKLQLRGVELHFVPEAVMHVRNRQTYVGIINQARHYAEYKALLYKKYRTGRELWRWKTYFSRWKDVLLSVNQVRSEAARARWLWGLGTQVGALQGSIKHRVPPV